MKSKKKVFMTVLCAAALVVASVLGTMAYLTSKTDTVTNTFTIGNVAITLDEAKVDTAGTPMKGDATVDSVEKADRVQANNYKLIPGHSYTKDPTVHVATGSEESWLFVKVDNQISGLEATGNTTIAAQMAAKGWTLVDGTTNVYAYNAKVAAGQDIGVFDSFTIAGNADISNYTGKTIKIEAYAVQADGFDTAAKAWAAAPATWSN